MRYNQTSAEGAQYLTPDQMTRWAVDRVAFHLDSAELGPNPFEKGKNRWTISVTEMTTGEIRKFHLGDDPDKQKPRTDQFVAFNRLTQAQKDDNDPYLLEKSSKGTWFVVYAPEPIVSTNAVTHDTTNDHYFDDFLPIPEDEDTKSETAYIVSLIDEVSGLLDIINNYNAKYVGKVTHYTIAKSASSRGFDAPEEMGVNGLLELVSQARKAIKEIEDKYVPLEDEEGEAF